MAKLEIHYDPDGGWAALYVDGDLNRVGDAYLAEAEAFELLGVTRVQDDAFLRGQTSREGAAQTLREVEEYRVKRDAKRARAAELRAEAARLIEEARDLDAGLT